MREGFKSMLIKKNKKDRQRELLQVIKDNPFLTDGELSEHFSVSIQTIRLDRLELNIPELRERIKNVAENTYDRVKAISHREIVGELLHLELGKSAISMLESNETMVFEKSGVVRGHYIYSMAESLAIALIDAESALTGVSNIKYKTPVYSGERLVAKGEVTKIRGYNIFITVRIYSGQKEVFRGKFILVTLTGEV